MGASGERQEAMSDARRGEGIGRAAVGPRVDDPALMLIDPYPWSAPLEEVRLKKN